MVVAHAARGASSAERWMACPGSIALSAGMPNESSVYAREGSCAHWVASESLINHREALYYKGVVCPEYPEIDIDEEMCSAVQIYLDTIAEAIKDYTATGYDDYELDIEHKFDLSDIYPGMFGTCDAVIYFPAWKLLIVFDYKHGFVSVPVASNKQTMYYGVGALIGKHNRAIEKVQLVIVQPNSQGEDVKEWTCDAVTMLDFISDLKAAAVETDKPGAALNPGEWCKYCPASVKCKALEALVLEKAMAEFDVSDTIVPTDPAVMTPEQLKVAWENAGIIESWAKNIKSYAHQQAIAGNILPGCKLVTGKANRRWVDPAEAVTLLNTLVMMGQIEGNFYTEPKLKTPKQVEALMGKEKNALKPLWVKGQGSLSLVLESDSREPARISAEDEFS